MSPTLVRVVVEGDELRAMDVAGAGAGVRLLLPSAPDQPVDLPVWNGNAYFAVDGSRPPIRTMTPLDQDQAAGRLAFEVVRHEGGLLTPWVDAVVLGGEVAVSGPSRGYQLDPATTTITYLGDQTALPAIRQLIAVTPSHVAVAAVVEVPDAASEIDIAGDPDRLVRWVHTQPDLAPGEQLVEALSHVELSHANRLWAAGEAAAMQRIRRHLFDDRALPRSVAHVRGYWKHGRSEDTAASE